MISLVCSGLLTGEDEPNLIAIIAGTIAAIIFIGLLLLLLWKLLLLLQVCHWFSIDLDLQALSVNTQKFQGNIKTLIFHAWFSKYYLKLDLLFSAAFNFL